MNKDYDKKYLRTCLLQLAGMVALMKLTNGAGFVLAVVWLMFALIKANPENLLCVLMMTIAMTMGNSYLIPKSGMFGYLQRFMMLVLATVMTTQIAGRRNSPYIKTLLLLLLYVAYMIIPSMNGWCPLISFLKLFLFTMVFLGYYGVANKVIMESCYGIGRVRSLFLSFAIFMLMGSVALIPFPGISQLTPQAYEQALAAGIDVTSLFTGMTLHSQMLGPACAMLGVVLFADLAFGLRRADKLYMVLLLCVPILIWKTSSRTAMGAMLAGVFFVLYYLMKARNVKRTWKGKLQSAVIVLGLVVGLAIIAVPSARKNVTDFVLKMNTSGDEEVSFDEVTASRRGRWDESMLAFKQKPMFGNGFQVDSGMQDWNVKSIRDVMSAPVEKGVWVSAVLEEGGVLGMMIFIPFVLTSLFGLIRKKAYVGATAFFMLIVLNLGEFSMFSMTSSGGLLWAIVFVAIMLDAQRNKTDALTIGRNWYGSF